MTTPTADLAVLSNRKASHGHSIGVLQDAEVLITQCTCGWSRKADDELDADELALWHFVELDMAGRDPAVTSSSSE